MRRQGRARERIRRWACRGCRLSIIGFTSAVGLGDRARNIASEGDAQNPGRACGGGASQNRGFGSPPRLDEKGERRGMWTVTLTRRPA
jgi:hypothetical protein